MLIWIVNMLWIGVFWCFSIIFVVGKLMVWFFFLLWIILLWIVNGCFSILVDKLKLLLVNVFCIVVEFIWWVCMVKLWVFIILKLYWWFVVLSILKFFLWLLLKWKLLLIIRNLIFSLFISKLWIKVLVFCLVNFVLNCIVSSLLIFCWCSNLYFLWRGFICVGVLLGIKIFLGCGLNIIMVVGSDSDFVFLSMLVNIVWWLWCMLLNLLIVSIYFLWCGFILFSLWINFIVSYYFLIVRKLKFVIIVDCEYNIKYMGYFDFMCYFVFIEY